MNRFFIPSSSISANQIEFDGPTAHQIRDVLRLVVGSEVIVLDDSGWQYAVQLTRVERGAATGKVVSKKLAVGEPKTKIVLYQAVLKGAKFEWVLQKGTELGIVAFVPVITQRSIPATEGESGRHARWQRIIQEAAEQSHSARLPRLHQPMPLAKTITHLSGLTLVPWEGESVLGLKDQLQHEANPTAFSINLFIGPEGGFGADEIASLVAAKAQTVTLGPRILRAETAGLVAASAILFHYGDLGG